MHKDHPEQMPNERESREVELIDAAWQQVHSLNKQRRGAPTPNLPPSAEVPEDRFEGYSIVRRIHRGGQGVVYQAIQESTKRTVAIKVVREGPFAGPADKNRFEREVELLGRLQHSGIVTIHDSGSAAGCFYYVMDYIEGQPLDVYMAGGRYSVDETLRLLAEICEAVNVAHLRGIIHRDLKPGNIRIDKEGQPHVLDFGLAKVATSHEEARAMTVTGQFVGSLPWAAPEQVEARPDRVDLRTDVYALGVILHQMLTGKFPYSVTGSPREVMERILNAEPQRPSRLRSEVNDEVDTIVRKCLNKDQERRYQSAGELARDVRRYLRREPLEAKRDSSWYVLRKTVHRHRYAVAAAVTFVMLVLAFGFITLFQAAQVARQRDRALTEAKRASRVQAFLESMFASVSPHNTPRADFAIRNVLDDGARRVEQELAGMPGVAANVYDTLGMTYNGLGLYREAVFHLRRAVTLRREALGEEHPLVAATMVHLANALHHKQDLHEAEATARRALAMRRSMLDPGAPGVAEAADQLAEVLVQLNRFEEAERLAREALEIRRAAYGDTSPAVADSMTTLGTCLRDTGRYEQAEVLLRDALDIIRRHRGPEATTGVLTHLARLCRLSGKLDEAESILREVIALRRRQLGDEHPALAWNVYSLCDLLLATGGDPAEAESLCREALQIQRLHLDPQDPDLVQYLERLADALAYNGATEEAEDLLDEAQAIQLANGTISQSSAP